MTKELRFIATLSLISLVYQWHAAADLFSGLGAAAYVLVIGVCVIWTNNPQEPVLIDNPLPRTYLTDAATAMEGIKTSLISTNFEGYKWRLLQFDPELSSIVACLDILDLELPKNRPLETVRRQVLLIAQFDDVERKTRIRLRWVVRCGDKRDFATAAIAHATAHIHRQMRRANRKQVS